MYRIGGTLFEDIRCMGFPRSKRGALLQRKRARLAADSELLRAMAAQHQRCRRLHRQSMETLERSMHTMAAAGDNLAQAIASCGHRLSVGMQWHPQYLPYLRCQLSSCACLVAEARDPRPARLL